MRLLNTKSLTLKFWQDGTSPPYAALSMVHQEGQLAYADFEKMAALGIHDENARHEYLKPHKRNATHLEACRVARQEGYDWIWIAMCCTDWSSRVEVNENVNLGYQRFRQADLCLVYLREMTEVWDLEGGFPPDEAFVRCEWFRRSWTLQELLAPKDVMFYNKNWQPLGTRKLLVRVLERITGISRVYLWGPEVKDARSAPCAERLSWGINRIATLPEDRVYALLGLFNIKMEVSYGEDWKAFARFRKKLLRNCDPTILFTAETLLRSKKLLLKQMDGPQRDTATFDKFRILSMLAESLDMNSQVQHIKDSTLRIAQSPPYIIDTRYCFTTICRKVQDYYVAWTLTLQEIQGTSFAVCIKVIPDHTFNNVAASSILTINGHPNNEVLYVRKERLCGFIPCQIFFQIRQLEAGFEMVETIQSASLRRTKSSDPI